MKKGELIYIPPSTEHRAENRDTETCRFMAINSPLGEDVTEDDVGDMKPADVTALSDQFNSLLEDAYDISKN